MRHSEIPSTVARAREATRNIHGKAIVDGASLEVPRGKIVLLTGKSGSGKSTLLRMMAGIVPPDTGDVELMGQNLAGMSRKSRKQLVADHVGVGFQMPKPHTNFSVRDNLYGLARARGQQVDFGFAAHIITSFGLTDKLQQQAGELSGGEMLRLGIGRVLMTRPDVLLLDEPTAALDGEAKATVVNNIASVCREIGASALIVTHEVDTARQVADREYQMAGGHIISMLAGPELRGDEPAAVLQA